jgi:hypothetical protein
VHARIGIVSSHFPQLGVQIIEIAKRAGEEEVLADIPIWPLELAFGRTDGLIFWLEVALGRELVGRALSGPGPGMSSSMREAGHKLASWIRTSTIVCGSTPVNLQVSTARRSGSIIRSVIVSDEECVLAIEDNWADAAFHGVGVELYTADRR